MTDLSARVERILKRLRNSRRILVLFGDDPEPEDITPETTVIRFDEQDRELL